MSCLEIIKWFGPFGLILDIIGAIFIFKFGLPKEISRSGGSYRISEEVNPNIISKTKKYDDLNKLGLIFLILGFALQLISSIINLI